MSKVIKFPSRRRERDDPEVLKLLGVSQKIDAIVIEALHESGLKPRDVAGVLAHRLGSLMRQLDEKDKLWDVCERVLKKQAAID